MLDSFVEPSRRHRPIAFWFLNHWLEEGELIRQVRELAEAGFGGFMLHPRDGLRRDYLSSDYGACLGCAIREAEKLGLDVWLYDDLHYPAGGAGFLMDLREDETMASLKVVSESEHGAGELVDLSVLPQGEIRVYAVEPQTGETIKLEPVSSWRVPLSWGNARIVVLQATRWSPVPLCFYDRFPDYTDPELTRRFISTTHQWYYDHFGEYFGKTIRGIFSDNTCGNFGAIRRSIPWGKDFPARFKTFTGESIGQHLVRLLDARLPDSDRSRGLFWKFFEHAYLDSYFGQITTYCREHDLYSTGHLACEDGLGEHTRQIGDYFNVMRHFSYCAVDDLGPEIPGQSVIRRDGDAGWLPQKLTASCARFLGREEVMCECLGLASEYWKLTLGEIRRITGWLAVAGINVFLPHGVYYSIAGSRKWECTPDHLHTPAWPYYRTWTDWIGRLSKASMGGVTETSVAVLHPSVTFHHSIELGVAGADGDRGTLTHDVERTFRRVVNRLYEHHVDMEIIDETLLAQATVQASGALKIPSARPEFSQEVTVLLLPSCVYMEKKTWTVLAEWSAVGGQIIVLDRSPEYLVDGEERVHDVQVDFPHVCQRSVSDEWLMALPRNLTISNPLLVSRVWRREGKRHILVFNPETSVERGNMAISDGSCYDRIDLETGVRYRWQEDDIVLNSGEAMLLVSRNEDVCEPYPVLPTRRLDIPEHWTMHSQGPNLWCMRAWRTWMAGSVQHHLMEVDVDSLPSQVTLILDVEMSRCELAAGHFSDRFQCLVNGVRIPAFRPGKLLDAYMQEADITAFLRLGHNRIELVCASTLHDWEWRVHPCILAGDFLVRGQHLSCGESLTVSELGHWHDLGYPHFSGTMVYEADIQVPGGDSTLQVSGQGMVVEAFLDQKSLGVRVSEPYAFAIRGATAGQQRLTIAMTTTHEDLFEGRPES